MSLVERHYVPPTGAGAHKPSKPPTIVRDQRPTGLATRKVKVGTSTTAPNTVLAQDEQRASVAIAAASGNTGTVYVGSDVQDTGSWFPLAPGATLSLEGTGWVFAYADNANDVLHAIAERY